MFRDYVQMEAIGDCSTDCPVDVSVSCLSEVIESHRGRE